MASAAEILDDLAFLIVRVEESIKGSAYNDLTANAEAYGALIYRLAMVGETCKKLPDEIKVRRPVIRWHEIATFRFCQP